MGGAAGGSCRLILIEGLPGSGKTSLAEWLCDHVRDRGERASWVPELRRDHPVIDRPTLRSARQPGYAGRCIDRWAAFARETLRGASPELLILEGCLFQGTVRFLLEYERDASETDHYLAGVEEALAPLSPAVVYLTQTDPDAYLRAEIVRRKGEEIVSRIAAYSATTPWALRRGLAGARALESLYANYRSTCDRLVRRLSVPVLEIDAVRFDEAAVRDRAGAFADRLVAPR